MVTGDSYSMCSIARDHKGNRIGMAAPTQTTVLILPFTDCPGSAVICYGSCVDSKSGNIIVSIKVGLPVSGPVMILVIIDIPARPEGCGIACTVGIIIRRMTNRIGAEMRKQTFRMMTTIDQPLIGRIPISPIFVNRDLVLVGQNDLGV